jgi:tyrosyl-DNA phosphodiesterase-1
MSSNNRTDSVKNTVNKGSGKSMDDAIDLENDSSDGSGSAKDRKPKSDPTRLSSAAAGRKRPFPSEGDKSQAKNSKKFSSLSDKKTARTTANALPGCMLRPMTAPIKIFATHQDEALRKTLPESAQENHWVFQHCWTLREMMGLDRFSALLTEGIENQGRPTCNPDENIGIDFVFITTYILDVDCLLSEIPELVHVPTVVIIYDYKDESEGGEEWWKNQAELQRFTLRFIRRSPKDPPRSKYGNDVESANSTTTLMEFGCHHTKMFLVKYRSGRLRVNIHTSNHRPEDFHKKCQAAFIQDFLPKTADQIFDSSDFEETLVTYMESYHFMEPLFWDNGPSRREAKTLVQHLQTYDFSTAVGVLIPSVPGYHPFGPNKESFGFIKVQKCIQKYCTTKISNAPANPGPIICQFSSIGSLTIPYLDKIAYAWNVDTAHTRISPSMKPPRGISSSLLKIIWPTFQEVATSVEGYQGGGSVPGRTKNLTKPFIGPLLHKWSGAPSSQNSLGKGNNVPHIKTYYQISSAARPKSDEEESMEWFVMTSHNLSKTAWGEPQNRMVEGKVLTVQHWELGVFVSPATLGVDSMGPFVDDSGGGRKLGSTSTLGKEDAFKCSRAFIPLPYKFRPDRYQTNDQFWATDLIV